MRSSMRNPTDIHMISANVDSERAKMKKRKPTMPATVALGMNPAPHSASATAASTATNPSARRASPDSSHSAAIIA